MFVVEYAFRIHITLDACILLVLRRYLFVTAKWTNEQKLHQEFQVCTRSLQIHLQGIYFLGQGCGIHPDF